MLSHLATICRHFQKMGRLGTLYTYPELKQLEMLFGYYSEWHFFGLSIILFHKESFDES